MDGHCWWENNDTHLVEPELPFFESLEEILIPTSLVFPGWSGIDDRGWNLQVSGKIKDLNQLTE